MSTRRLNLVFVYGTLKRGHGNHVLLENSDYLGEAVSELSRYEMRAPETGGFPFVTDVSVHSKNKGRILGEIYRVDDSVLDRLDLLEGHPSFYTRRIRTFKLLDSGEVVAAWIYLHPRVDYPLCDKIILSDGDEAYVWNR